MKQIVPWALKCHDCSREFGLSGGGLCKKCGRPTCNRCLGIGAVRRILQLMKPESQVCRSCAATGDEKPTSEGSP